ncbi:unnamed protein product [Adineta ricciae]|uniref:Uncharacterized protein n=1 Tax=Adineta ricciae TaxID=249248 RepID=A0A815N542_ADIRI|nr:unnamed protein product [Adineta ricciae]
MYCQIHKPPEHKKDDLDVILVKLPLTPSRYRDYRQRRDGPANPYKPTYTFPDEYNGDLERMEDYIRKSAVSKLNNDPRNFSSSPVRTPTATINDYPTNGKRNPEKMTRFSDQLTTSNTSPTIERAKPINVTIASPVTVNSRSNTTHPTQPPPPSSSSTDDEQKSIYKRVLRGGDIPSIGLQKRLPNNRVSSSSIQRPLILSNHSSLPSALRLFAYYSVHWEQNQSNQLKDLINNGAHFEINSCLYFQTQSQPVNQTDFDDDDNEWEQTREDGCGYVIIYPPHIHPTDNLQIYNFDRKKHFLLTSNDVYEKSKKPFLFSKFPVGKNFIRLSNKIEKIKQVR